MLLRNLTRRCISFAKPSSEWKKPVRVVITGANGNIGYATAFRVASGDMLGQDQPIILHLLDLPFAQQGLVGLNMELDDCAFPLLQSVVTTDDYSKAFKDVDFAMMIGSKPRGPGMERADLLRDNGNIFVGQGKALNDYASRSCKTLVVGNPANTNCLILQSHCPDLPKKNFTSMTRLDHDRGISQLASYLNCRTTELGQFAIWGNHSPSMYPDVSNLLRNNECVTNLIGEEWRTQTFIPKVQQRGAEIIANRKLSSAASAGSAAISHMRDWHLGTNGQWTSMSILNTGQYGVSKDLMFSYPVVIDAEGNWEMVQGLEISQESRKRIQFTENELLEERNAIESMLG